MPTEKLVDTAVALGTLALVSAATTKIIKKTDDEKRQIKIQRFNLS